MKHDVTGYIYIACRLRDIATAVAFDDPVEASAYAMKNELYPFAIQRIAVHNKDAENV